MWRLLAQVVVGFVSGYLSGQLGIGGGIVTTPAIRVLLGYPATIAVGTPLAIIIPTSLVAMTQYARAGFVDRALAVRAGLAGSVGAVMGAYVTRLVPGGIILLLTSAVMIVVAVRFAARGSEYAGARVETRRGLIYGVGLAAGLFSGFLGLGGGTVLIPAFVVLLGRDTKTAFGTSLAVVCAMALPGAVVHWLLGHIDIRLAALMMAGVIPGAWAGAHVAIRAREATLRRAFAAFLVLAALVMGAGELVRVLR